jgi:hypothetical protein
MLETVTSPLIDSSNLVELLIDRMRLVFALFDKDLNPITLATALEKSMFGRPSSILSLSVAQEVADTKNTADVRPLFRQGQEIAEKKPKTLITDGATNFHEAYMKEFWTQNKINRTEHIREIRLAGKVHNNKMERMNGEIRDRERCMRTLEKADTPILKGMQLYLIYVRA